jgi:hypothetical protein
MKAGLSRRSLGEGGPNKADRLRISNSKDFALDGLSNDAEAYQLFDKNTR